MNFIYLFPCRSISKYFREGETNIYIYIYIRTNINFFFILVFFLGGGGLGGNGPPLPWGRSALVHKK